VEGRSGQLASFDRGGTPQTAIPLGQALCIRQSFDVTYGRSSILFSVDIDFSPLFTLPAPSFSVLTMSVRVVARIRPLLKQEIDKDTIVTAETLDGETTPAVVRIPSPKNEAESFSFQFSSVYEQDATQQQLFDAESEFVIRRVSGLKLTPS
jgi:hypothetical protein